MSARETIQRFNTEQVPPAMRFDFWLSILRESLWPVTEWTDLPRDFNVELHEASFGCLASMRETVSPHRSRRTRSDLTATGEHFYLLFANQLTWDVAHNGHAERIAGGDCVLVDSQGDLDTTAPSGFNGVILKLPVGWVQTWLPNPELIVGERIGADSNWGRVLTPIVRQLTPEFVAAPPLPHGVLVDQLGTMLALIAGGADARTMPELLRRVRDCIRQRCYEPELTGGDVAASLGIPSKKLHQVLAANGLTFAGVLLDARVAVAREMLTSPSYVQVTTMEISRRAGFGNVAFFERAVRKRTGQSPQALRRGLLDRRYDHKSRFGVDE